MIDYDLRIAESALGLSNSEAPILCDPQSCLSQVVKSKWDFNRCENMEDGFYCLS